VAADRRAGVDDSRSYSEYSWKDFLMFLHPHFLWLLSLPLLLAIYQLRRPTGVTGSRKLLATGLRMLALSLVILALAQPFRQIPETNRCVVALVDCSPSMDAAASEQASAGLNALVEQAGRDNVRLVIFGETAREVAMDDAVLAAGGLAKLRFTEPGSSVAEALELAAALCPDDGNGEIHLFSDARETRGDMVSAAARLGRRGQKLKIHELGAILDSPVLLHCVRSPGSGSVGEAVAMTAEIECSAPCEARLSVVGDKGQALVNRTLLLRAGVQEVSFRIRPEEGGFQRYHVSLDRGDKTVIAGLNVSRTVVGVVETAPKTPATRALQDILARNAVVKRLTPADLAGDRPGNFDVLVLADTPAAELPVKVQQNLRTWVAGGGGLLVTGGRNAFGPGGYARSELADILPLRFPQKKEVRDPSTSLAIIIDTSGSMGVAGVNLAKEVARLAIKRLKPHDKAGIVEFHGAKRWAAPMQPASNSIAIQRALNRLSAGGGTVMMPAIEEAYYGLLNVRTRTKHVLVLTDGGVEQGAFATLLRRMADDGIHVSTVLVGPRAASSFLAQLASWGRGQFYTAPSRFKLPEVIIKQPSSSLLNPFVEKEVRIEPVLASRLTQDMKLENAPMLRGYVKTETKDTTELLLRSEIGDPILARWHYGLGRVAILTTQLGGDWARELLNWPDAPNMMANLIRQLRGVSPRQPLDLNIAHSSAGLTLGIRALSSDPLLAAAMLRIEVRDAEGALVAKREIMPVRAHAWRTLIENPPAGDYLVEVKDAAGEKVLAAGGLVVPPPNEFSLAAPDRDKLTAAARAAADSSASVDSQDTPVRTSELWSLCAALGLLSFILMILIRRLPGPAAAPKSPRAVAAGLALLAGLGALGLPSAAMGQEVAEKPTLTPVEKERIDGFIKLEPAQGRRKLKDHCRKLTQLYGDLQPLCDYLESKKTDDKAAGLLAVAAIANGNLDLAGQTLGALTGKYNPDIWILSQTARVQEMRGNSAEAQQSLKLALEKTGDPGMRFVMLVRSAQLFYDAKATDAARTAIRGILARPEFKKPEARNYCARIAGLHGDYELAAELFTPIGQGRQLMRDRIYFGQILMYLEKPAKAREQFDAALKISRLQRDRRYILDRIVSAAREADQLPKLMDQWLAADDMLPEQLEILVGVLGGELDRAKDVLALLERRDLPERTQKLIQSSAFQERLIQVALETGKSELALRKYRELAAAHPKDLYYHNGYVRLLLMDGERAQAEAFFGKTIAASESVIGLMKLATSARNMALEKVAMEAASKADGMGEMAHVQAVLFEAELHRQRGDVDKTLEILRAMEKEIGDDAELMAPLSDAYERYGYKADATRLIQKAYGLTKNEKLLEKLIGLMETQQRHDQLFVLWRKLWETASEPMAIIQAQDRLLDLGSKNGKLADIAIELEERLDEGELSDRELAMLLEIYTSVNDPVSAADILLELSSRRGGDKIKIYDRMLQVYMECELFGRCNAVLRKLIKLDPKNRDDYLQSLALIALERKNDGDAVAVLEELSARSADGMLRDTFSASVLNMIGRHDEAARIYRRSLADNPDEVEAWLLWGNSLVSSANKGVRRRRIVPSRYRKPPTHASMKQAIGMFSVLMEESADDDMFTIALDGLLNVGATQQVLRSALRRVNERIAMKPHKMFLYRLAADLHEELGQQNEMRMVLEQGIIVAEDGRSIILRELIAMARAAKNNDDVIRYGRSLLNTAEHLPPNECLELGTMLLEKGYFSEADSAFQRVIAGGDATGVTRDIILRYENAGLYGKAGKLLRELLIGSPFDVELLLRLGVIEEKKGNFLATRKAYQQALELMIGRLPRLLRKEPVTTAPAVRRYRRSYNLDETRQYFDLAAQGLISSARTPESRQQLLDAARTRVQVELKNLETNKAFGKTHAENPRLLQITGLLRRLGFAFHRPEYFDPMDDDLLKRYPEDESLFASLQNQRRQWGMLWNAQQFQTRNNKAKDDTLVISPHLNDHDKLKDTLSKHKMNSSSAAAVLPLLAMCGHDDLVDALLARIKLKGESRISGIPLAAVGLATNRSALVREVLFNTLSQIPRSTYMRSTFAIKIQDHLCAAWPVLSKEDRSAVVDRYGLILEGVKSYRLREIQPFHYYLLCQVGRSRELDVKVLSGYVKGAMSSRTSESYTWAAVLCWLLDKPAAQRPAALKQLITPIDAKYRTVPLMQFAMLLDDKDISDELVKVFAELFKPTKVSGYAVSSGSLFFSGYRKNRLTDHVKKVMAGGDYGFGLLADKGRADQMKSKFKSAVQSIRLKAASDIRMVSGLYGATLRRTADLLSPEQLDVVLKDYISSSKPVDMLIAFLLLQQAGRETEAVTVLRRISALSPDDVQAAPVRAAMPKLLIRCRWHAHAPQFFADGADDPVTRARVQFQLHDSLALLGGSAGNALVAGARRMYGAMLMKDPAQFTQSVRIYWAETRHPSILKDRMARYRMRTWPGRVIADPGGLLGPKTKSSGTILDDLGALKGSQDELSYWLGAMPSGQAQFCDALASNVRRYGLSRRLGADIDTAAKKSLLNRVDLQTITAIAAQSPGQLPKSLADQIPLIILFNQHGDSDRIAALSKACKALGIGNFARSLNRWSVTHDIQSRGASRWLGDYIAYLPENERRDALKKLLPYLGINDLRKDACGDEAALFAALLDLGMKAEAADLADRYLRRLRLIDARSASGFKMRPYYQTTNADGRALHDALAVVLARLNRPQDYKRVLTRRMLFEPQNPRLQRPSMSILAPRGYIIYSRFGSTSKSDLEDYTGALPEPDQVEDINRYIDMHLEMIAWLRGLGRLNRESYIAKICMLGKWCADRGLKTRAASLLALAGKNSKGMLTGHLWIADLHRVLGQEEPAAAIERELLRHDLLPMARVPAALKTIARKDGQANADAIAYRIASYSNHPEILPMALRHTRVRGLKEEAKDLAERLHKVSTLFLPPKT
jgi:Ca-activated chloride channel homolog